MGGKFRFSAQDRDLEYLFWRSKNLPVPSDIIPPLVSIINQCYILLDQVTVVKKSSQQRK